DGGPLLQEIDFHTSCSQPLGSGDQFGANYVNGILFENGYVCGEVDAPPAPADCCDIGNKPSEMTFIYTGEDCSASQNTQDPSKAECLGNPAMDPSVYIIASDGGSEIYFEGTVGINEAYTISASNAGQTQLDNNSIIYIYDSQGGTLLQEANFHASCSQPLGAGDQFGANFVQSILFDDGYFCQIEEVAGEMNPNLEPGVPVTESNKTFLDMSMKIYPNPFKRSATVEFVVPKDDTARVEVYSLTGQLLQTLFSGQIKGGNLNQFTFSPKESMAAGIYLIKLQTDYGIVQYKRLIYRP
ncbi:MAG: T9SS type A sorting domain-containing protein, partial [Saprospiraceae bacterium]|nr:T9SS type A sorting domain-containing protein [Flavobacteriaceae bacterium]NNE26384.1 T9SS type A sorting domain-containing protein [Saprospiraceae bacterium]